ncbi:alpha/beta hydrolase [Myxococcus sp. AM009]|uniref:alpha/beta fold hydrolase n=1 Tax=unclassified Myxococcus TaxID=2648731 RepID=UPI001595463E|nr:MULTISPECIES: alpha/beta hydrolase [unclassified Myxococcus]NVJ00714.1 alpha/beta hydrolase [Myxococcus sp. AM009]NVJ16933.1 alpha/beta hydrolase [Myxococcus sp. AM010]
MRKLLAALLALPVLAACGPAPESDSNDTQRVPEGAEVASTEQGLFGMPRERSVRLRTGVTLRYVEQGLPLGPAVVFLHGYSDSHHTWDLNLRTFPRDHHVYVLDQRGHGDSTRPACCYTQQSFAADVEAFLDSVGERSAILVGHSMGSFIAQQVALDFPRRVKGLVLVGSAPTVAGNPVALELKSIVDTFEGTVDPEFIRAFQESTFVRPVPASYINTLVSESSKVPARVWQDALDGMLAEDHSARLNRIRVPVLVVGGDQDGFFPVADQRALVNALPDAEFKLYPNTGHAPHAEQPRRFNQDVHRFLRDVTRG